MLKTTAPEPIGREKQDLHAAGPIPRTIHYVWFGGKPLPAEMRTGIDGWRRLMPGYEVIEWNESNYDVTSHPWMKRMYDERRFAFASDYARFQILLERGGIYMDTDVVMKKSLEPLLRSSCLWSFELDAFLSTCFIATAPGHPLIAALLAEYDKLDKPLVNNSLVTEYFLDNFPEFQLNNREQIVGKDIHILPKEYLVVPSFDRRKNYAVHNANNHWRADRKKRRRVGIVRGLIGEVLFYKLLNRWMYWKSEYPARARARKRAAKA